MRRDGGEYRITFNKSIPSKHFIQREETHAIPNYLIQLSIISAIESIEYFMFFY